jgi:hypothetical protein
MIDVKRLQPGDLLILPDQDGLWGTVLEYVGPDRSEHGAGRILTKDRKTGQLFSSLPAGLIQPAVGGDNVESPEKPPASRAEPRKDGGGITESQRKLIFALGHSYGLDIDDLRAMTPAGSISMLTQADAGRLIDRLQGNPQRSRRSAQGTATAKQLGLIEQLQAQIGFGETGFGKWLQKRFKVGSLDDVRDRGLASRIIGGLLAFERNVATRGTGRRAGRRSGT